MLAPSPAARRAAASRDLPGTPLAAGALAQPSRGALRAQAASPVVFPPVLPAAAGSRVRAGFRAVPADSSSARPAGRQPAALALLSPPHLAGAAPGAPPAPAALRAKAQSAAAAR